MNEWGFYRSPSRRRFKKRSLGIGSYAFRRFIAFVASKNTKKMDESDQGTKTHNRQIKMTFNDIDEFKKVGFAGFKKMSDLFLDNSMIPDRNGVYLVLNADNRPIEFLSVGSGGHFKGKNPNVSIAELKVNWVDDTKVVYIGKATSLKSRLRQYLGFGQGKNIGHYGGRLIWQLKDSKDLIVCWKVLNTDPREFEAGLIRQFVSIYGCRPFANLKN